MSKMRKTAGLFSAQKKIHTLPVITFFMPRVGFQPFATGHGAGVSWWFGTVDTRWWCSSNPPTFFLGGGRFVHHLQWPFREMGEDFYRCLNSVVHVFWKVKLKPNPSQEFPFTMINIWWFGQLLIIYLNIFFRADNDLWELDANKSCHPQIRIEKI